MTDLAHWRVEVRKPMRPRARTQIILTYDVVASDEHMARSIVQSQLDDPDGLMRLHWIDKAYRFADLHSALLVNVRTATPKEKPPK